MKTNSIFRICISAFIVFLFSISLCFAQEERNEDEQTIDLPPVKIEIVDATQLNIPKENFDGLTQPDYDIYVTLSRKERLWYLPSTSIPKKYEDKSAKQDKDFLVVLSAYPGLPAALSYQALMLKGFGKSQVLLDLGRSSLLGERTAKLSSDHTKKQSGSTIDRFRGLFSYQMENSGFRSGLNYNAKDLDYLDIIGERYPNDRSIFNISMGWNQRLPNNFEPSINAEISKLMMEGPLSSDSSDALDIKMDVNINSLLSPSIPIDTGAKIEHFAANGVSEDFRETLVKLYFRDRRIRIWPFILSVGIELAADIRKTSLDDEGWKTSVYPNPYALLTSQLGSKTVLQFGLERYILKQNIEDIYIKNGYMYFNPGLIPERGLEIFGQLKLNLIKGFTAKVGYSDKDISDIAFPEESPNSDGAFGDRIIYWLPKNQDNIHISAVNAGWELSLLDDKLKQSIEYVYEIYDQDEYVPYRPENKGVLSITYLAPNEFELSLIAELYGPRQISENEKLPKYILWKPKISKSFGKNAEASLALEFYAGSGDYEVLKGYALSKQTMDFGLSVRF